MYATIAGNRLAYSTHGDAGPWVVLSHSLACDRTMWDPQIAALAARYRVLAYDTRGHGGSDAPPAPYTLADLADDALGLMDALGIERAHFVGLSMGGMTAQHAAVKAPGRFLSLVLADTTSRYPAAARPVWDERMALARREGMAPLVQPTLERWFTEAFRRAQPETVARVGRLIASTPVEGYVGCSDAVSRMNLLERLGEITCPVLVIVGADDAGTPGAMHEEIHRAIPHSKLVIIPQAAHLSNIEQPAAFDAAMLPFLQAVPAG